MVQHFIHINDTLETKDQHVSCPIYIFSTLPDCKSYLTLGLFVISSSQRLDLQTRFVSLAECWKRNFIMKMYYYKMWFWCLVLFLVTGLSNAVAYLAAPAIFGHFITVSQGQHPQWNNSINTQHPQY